MESYIPTGVVGFENFPRETLDFMNAHLQKPIALLSIPELKALSQSPPPLVESLVACMPHAYISEAVTTRTFHLAEAARHALSMALPDELDITEAQVAAAYHPVPYIKPETPAYILEQQSAKIVVAAFPF